MSIKACHPNPILCVSILKMRAYIMLADASKMINKLFLKKTCMVEASSLKKVDGVCLAFFKATG